MYYKQLNILKYNQISKNIKHWKLENTVGPTNTNYWKAGHTHGLDGIYC